MGTIGDNSKGVIDNKKTVLIIDDDARMARSIQRTLEKNGFKTEIAFDGFSASTALERLRPSVVTLDLALPGMGGIEVIRLIRESPRFRHIKILLISARLIGELEDAKKAGADDVLEKPYLNSVLLEKIDKLLGA